MLSATRLAAVASLVGLICAARPAPDAWTDTTPPPALRPGVRVSSASLTFFTNRAAFQARASQLVLEDFEKGNVPVGGVVPCPGPLSSTSTNNPCFSPGSLQPGVVYNSNMPHGGVDELGLVGQGFDGAPSNNLVADHFGEALVITFTGGNVTAVGADILAYFSNNVCTIQISGAQGPLGSATAPCTIPGTFWGVMADEPITEIRIVSSLGATPAGGAPGVDNLAFGAGAPTTIHVALDVKPGSDVSPINPRSQGVTPVAVLSTADFDAAQIDVSSLGFGPGGAPAVHEYYGDVNGDGRPDLVVQFSTPAARIACGDTQLTMTGRTQTGRRVMGTGAIQTVGCTKS